MGDYDYDFTELRKISSHQARLKYFSYPTSVSNNSDHLAKTIFLLEEIFCNTNILKVAMNAWLHACINISMNDFKHEFLFLPFDNFPRRSIDNPAVICCLEVVTPTDVTMTQGYSMMTEGIQWWHRSIQWWQDHQSRGRESSWKYSMHVKRTLSFDVLGNDWFYNNYNYALALIVCFKRGSEMLIIQMFPNGQY